MLPPIPIPADYGISPDTGFLPSEPPLEQLPDPYYAKWESVMSNIQALLLSRRIRYVVDRLPLLSTSHLDTEPEWRRAYSILGFILHGYVWGGSTPAERVPPQLTVPLLEVCDHLELPPVATYAGLVLWNFKPIFPDESMDDLDNLACINTITGSLDEQWFYLVSVAIEARGGPAISLVLQAIAAARVGNSGVVMEYLQALAEMIDDIGALLERMYEHNDPYVFYNKIRPYLAGSKNMADAGLPNGVLYDDGKKPEYRQYGGGSNAQSSLIQFLDIALGVEHRPTGEARASSDKEGVSAPRHGFIQEMRSYMPGPHRRFLEHTHAVANIREYVEAHRSDKGLCIAYDACLSMLQSMRTKHIQMVSRYIINPSQNARPARSSSPRRSSPLNLATAGRGEKSDKSKLRGTGGTALIPFLKQARNETGEPMVDTWARRLLTTGTGNADSSWASLSKLGERRDGDLKVVGLAGTWTADDSEGGICHW